MSRRLTKVRGHLPGRRMAAGRRVTTGTAIAIAAPVIALLALALQAPATDQIDRTGYVPESVPLVRMDLGCPGSPAGRVQVGSAATEDGTIFRRSRGAEPQRLRLAQGGQVRIEALGDFLIQAEDGLAQGLFGARVSTEGRPAASACAAPVGERWFVGAGAGANHLTSMVLINPDPGPAMADVTLFGAGGRVVADPLQGMIVPGRATMAIDLEELAPTRGDLAVRVQVNRGRLTVTAQDAYGRIGGPLRRDGFASSAEPSTAQIVPGLTREADQRLLTLVNPGDTEARVKLSVIGARSTFAASGLREIIVPAGSVNTAELTRPLKRALADGDGALRLDSNVPVTAGLRTVVGDDLVQLPSVPLITGPSATVLPATGKRTLLVSGGEDGGTVNVTWLGGGKPVTINLVAGTTRAVKVPVRAYGVRLDSATDYLAVVRAEASNGAAILVAQPLLLELLVPAVRPEWPPR